MAIPSDHAFVSIFFILIFDILNQNKKGFPRQSLLQNSITMDLL